MNLPTPTPKKGENRWSDHGSIRMSTCQRSVPENTPCTWPIVPSMLNVSEKAIAGPQLQHRLGLEMSPAHAELHLATQVVIEKNVTKALCGPRGGERRLELLAADPADLVVLGADLEPVGVAQLDLDPVVARRDEEDRIAAARPAAQLYIGIGDLHHLGLAGARRGARAAAVRPPVPARATADEAGADAGAAAALQAADAGTPPLPGAGGSARRGTPAQAANAAAAGAGASAANAGALVRIAATSNVTVRAA